MKVYPVYLHSYADEDEIKVFTTLQKAITFVEYDKQAIEDMLLENGYEPIEMYRDNYHEIYVSNNNIYYEWTIFEGELN